MDNHVGSETREKGFSSKSIFQKGFWRGTGNARNPNGEALLRGIGWAAASFILGICRLPFSVYPLGMAILCASDTYIGFSVAGLVVASFFLPIPWWIYLGAVALTLLGRILTRLLVDIPVRTHEVTGFRGMLEHIHGRLFCESLYLRMSSSCVATFLLSLYALFVGGFRYYDLFGAFFSIFSASVATFFLCSFSGDMPFGQRFVFWIRRIAECLLAFSICLSFSEMRLQGISLGVATAFVATLILCRKEGLFIGLLTSLLCGFSCGGSYFAIFPVVAITAFCLFEFSPYLSAFVSCVIGSVTGVLLVGKDNLLVIFLPLIFGAASYCTYEKLLAKGGFHTLFWPSKQRVSCEHLRLERQYAETCEEVGAFCHSLKTLSESFSHMNENMRKPVDRELKEICDVCLGDVCAVCDNRSGCLETRYTLMEEATERMMLRLKKDGIVAMENLPKEFVSFCLHVEDLIELVNTKTAVLREKKFATDKIGVFAADYSAISEAFEKLVLHVKMQYQEDSRRTVAVRDKLRELGFEAADVSVCGERNSRIFILGLSPIPEHKRLLYLQKQLSRTLDCTLKLPLLTLCGDTCFVYAEREVCFESLYGTAIVAKEGISGDSVRVFDDKRHHLFYSLINDGMGAGKDAALTSGISGDMMQTLFEAGADGESILHLLNNFLSLGRNSGGNESSTTVDLLCLDKMTGRAVFLKSGAAASYVKREGNVFKMTGTSMPIGILPLVDAKQIEFDTQEGDMIIQVSDGVTGGESECLWLLDYLTSTAESDPAVVAEYIKDAALANGSDDDISVVVTKICQKN